MSDHELTTTTPSEAVEQSEAAQSQAAEESKTETRAESVRRPVVRPNVRIHETDDVVGIAVELPGVPESHIDLTLEKNVLTIEAKNDLPSHDGERPLHREFGPVVYRRSFSIHEEIDRDSIDATLTDGVLRITLTKVKPETTRVKINVG